MNIWLVFLFCFQLLTHLCFAQSIDTAILMGRYTTQKESDPKTNQNAYQNFNKSNYNKKRKFKEVGSTQQRKPASSEEVQEISINTTKVVQSNMATGKKSESIQPDDIKRINDSVQTNANEGKSENPNANAEQTVTIDIKEPTVRDQMKHLFTGKGKEIEIFYKENTHPEDVRNNKIELEFSPKYISNSSKSNYFYRNYGSSYPALSVKTNVWFVPGFGISGKFQFAFASAITGNPNDSSKVLTRNENVEFSMNFRNYFGISRKANSLEFQVLFLDSIMTVPSDELYRYGFDSSGLGVGFKMRNPENIFMTTYYGMQFYPKLVHKETSSGTSANSGTNRETSRIGIEYGKEYILGKDSVVSYGFELTNETNSFKGTVSVPDPISSDTPDGVSVSNTTVGFVLGYRWGR